MTRIAVTLASLLALAPALSACCICDPEGHARDRAGEGAIDCGFVPFDADPEAALVCAEDAIASGASFFVGIARHGTDSDVRTYVSGRGDGTFEMFGYDGDPSGGSGQCARLVAFECTAAPSRASDILGREFLSCPSGGDGVVLCSR